VSTFFNPFESPVAPFSSPSDATPADEAERVASSNRSVDVLAPLATTARRTSLDVKNARTAARTSFNASDALCLVVVTADVDVDAISTGAPLLRIIFFSKRNSPSRQRTRLFPLPSTRRV
jgi:hypothetical protein